MLALGNLTSAAPVASQRYLVMEVARNGGIRPFGESRTGLAVNQEREGGRYVSDGWGLGSRVVTGGRFWVSSFRAWVQRQCEGHQRTVARPQPHSRSVYVFPPGVRIAGGFGAVDASAGVLRGG